MGIFGTYIIKADIIPRNPIQFGRRLQFVQGQAETASAPPRAKSTNILSKSHPSIGYWILIGRCSMIRQGLSSHILVWCSIHSRGGDSEREIDVGHYLERCLARIRTESVHMIFRIASELHM